MTPRQYIRQLYLYTQAQATALLASATRIAAFQQGAFVMEVDNATRALRRILVKANPGNLASDFVAVTTGVESLPSTPAAVLLDATSPNEVVTLGAGGFGSSQTRAEFVAAFSLATIETVQTLTNKTLTSPTINNPTLTNPRAAEYLGTLGTVGVIVEGAVALNVPIRFVPGQTGVSASFIRPSAGAGNNSLHIQPENDGNVILDRPVNPNGTVADINGGAGIFANPVLGQFALATDAVGGAKPAWYDGAAWRTADGAVLV